jgi:uncharacterized protein (DUF2252 family)
MVNPVSSFVARSRPSWVAGQLYAHHHQFAAHNRADLKVRMEKMATASSAFPFFRATAHLFYLDMATHPSAFTTEQTGYTWLTGDAHVGNFGARRDSTGTAVFGIADFDEGYLGQYLWDLRRLAASMVLLGRQNHLSDGGITSAIQALAGAYEDRMAAFRGNSSELRFRLTEDNTSGVVQDTIRRAAQADSARLLDKYTERNPGGLRHFVAAHEDLAPVTSGTRGALLAAMDNYAASIPPALRQGPAFYNVLDVRQRLGAGMGSLGKMRWYLLLQGNDDQVLLEVKQAMPSAVCGAGGPRMPPETYGGHEGCRQARSQRAHQVYPDPMTGWTMVEGMHCYVHEKHGSERDFDPQDLTTAAKLETAARYLGMALASAHALADQDFDNEVCRYSIDKHITELLGSSSSFQQELVSFAYGYSVQVELDWQAFRDARRAGTALY